MKVRRFDHIHIYCSNPDESMRFYTEVLHAKPVGQALSRYGRLVEFLGLGRLTVVLAPYPPGMEPAPPPTYGDGAYRHGFGVAHFGLSVEDLNEAVESVRRWGGNILAAPKERAGFRYAYIEAPDGVVIELAQVRWRVGCVAWPPMIRSKLPRGLRRQSEGLVSSK